MCDCFCGVILGGGGWVGFAARMDNYHRERILGATLLQFCFNDRKKEKNRFHNIFVIQYFPSVHFVWVCC